MITRAMIFWIGGGLFPLVKRSLQMLEQKRWICHIWLFNINILQIFKAS